MDEVDEMDEMDGVGFIDSFFSRGGAGARRGTDKNNLATEARRKMRR